MTFNKKIHKFFMNNKIVMMKIMKHIFVTKIIKMNKLWIIKIHHQFMIKEMIIVSEDQTMNGVNHTMRKKTFKYEKSEIKLKII